MTAPKWASALVCRVAEDEGIAVPPRLTWRRSRTGWLSSGHTKSDLRKPHITVTAGKSRKDQKLVLLHELAHWLAGPDAHHGARFWDQAWTLYRRYKVPLRMALQRERTYRKEAAVAYRRNMQAQREN